MEVSNKSHNFHILIEEEYMKKNGMVLLLLFTAFSAFAQSGTILESRGTVEIKLPGSDSFVVAKDGTVLTHDTIISTGFKSFAKIKIGDAIITVRPLTRLSLTEIQSLESTEKIDVYLQTGRVKIDVNPPAGKEASFSVASPSAVASVRGTSFEFDTRNLYVNEGKVSFTGNSGQTVTVEEGDNSQIDFNGGATNPVEVKITALMPFVPSGTDIYNKTNNRPIHP
jgi:hypothetical protein